VFKTQGGHLKFLDHELAAQEHGSILKKYSKP
jgi:hypothetical protein